MITLITQPVAPLLDRLLAEAALLRPETSPVFAGMAERGEQLMRSKSGHVELYSQLKDYPLPVSRDTGLLLYMLARSFNARSIIEFGTSFGISSLFLAAALRDNGGGRLITTEFEPSKVARARGHLEEGGLADLVEIREGDALQTLAADLPEAIDLVLLDGAKPLYRDILALLEPQLSAGAFIVADNADYCPDYLAYVRSPANGYLSVPFGDEVELSMRIGRRP
ncbi:Putative O-methyltransferase [Bradyrhizobium sp. ORS 278]|uniref:O-methyltransferase n=1 Tax=Bradyrhizobium sp. (strain ORS 278) TaxID=114615 RepID=UPI00015089B6|nr:class I SAM-dependent methyltransferase [Bradyrhizobium sp. ORS 278]CAL78583.1 Putative O-methyltransferase [Bradyrhizobium sp. ORS 278]